MKQLIALLILMLPVFSFAMEEAVPTLISNVQCKAWHRSGDECIDLRECGQYSDWCNSCTVSEDGELLSCTERQCFREGIPKCEQFRMPTNLSLSSMQILTIETTWKLVQSKVGMSSVSDQQEIYKKLIIALSTKVQEMNYTKTIARFTEEGLLSFNLKLDVYRYFLYKARMEVK